MYVSDVNSAVSIKGWYLVHSQSELDLYLMAAFSLYYDQDYIIIGRRESIEMRIRAHNGSAYRLHIMHISL